MLEIYGDGKQTDFKFPRISSMSIDLSNFNASTEAFNNLSVKLVS
jgi:hypothetical protein